MKTITWKGKPFKQLSFGKSKSAGRNSSGSITIFHRGGGSKRLQRRIDFLRNSLSTGVVERIEYDPNRSSRIALIRWSNIEMGTKARSVENYELKEEFGSEGPSFFSYILACDQMKVGDNIMNKHLDSAEGPTMSLAKAQKKTFVENHALVNGALELVSANPMFLYGLPIKKTLEDRQLYQKIGTNCTLAQATLGSFLHNVERTPGLGGTLVRAAGTFGQLVQKFENKRVCVVRLPSGRQYLLDLLCRATIGVVSNASHNTRKLTKAGQSRWLGKRPVVRGVAMNPIDHPHGGGEGRTKGGRPSVSPWGKPTKGARTACRNLRRKDLRYTSSLTKV